MEKRIKISGPGLFWPGQTPKFKNAGSGVPWRKFWIGYHARSRAGLIGGSQVPTGFFQRIFPEPARGFFCIGSGGFVRGSLKFVRGQNDHVQIVLPGVT